MNKIKEKLVVIDYNGKLYELGGIRGPVMTPTKLKIETIITLINSHKNVYEINPYNKSQRVLLTLHNARVVNFTAPVAKTANAPSIQVMPEVKASKDDKKNKNTEPTKEPDFK